MLFKIFRHDTLPWCDSSHHSDDIRIIWQIWFGHRFTQSSPQQIQALIAWANFGLFAFFVRLQFDQIDAMDMQGFQTGSCPHFVHLFTAAQCFRAHDNYLWTKWGRLNESVNWACEWAALHRCSDQFSLGQMDRKLAQFHRSKCDRWPSGSHGRHWFVFRPAESVRGGVWLQME